MSQNYIFLKKKTKLNTPNKKKYYDIAFIENKNHICNQYVYKMLKKHFFFLSGEICFPIINIISKIDKILGTEYLKIHLVKNSNNDLDVNNLFSKYPTQIKIQNLTILGSLPIIGPLG